MEEAAVAAVLQAPIQNLIDFLKNEISQIQGLDEEAAKLAGTLEIIQKFLNHAESGTITGEDVKSWLRKLEDVAFDADNVLDKFNYHRLSQQIKPKKAKVPSFFKHVRRSRNMALKIKKIRENLECINKDAAVLGLKERLAAAVPTLLHAEASETDSYAVDPIFIGRDDVVSEIVEMLTNSITTDERRVSISIVGMGGLGKTALTRKVFNHEMVKTRFASHIWVHVSPNFEPITLLKKILNNLASHHQVENVSREVVLKKLQEALKDKTYLLVLDDAWNEDLFKWEDFMNSFLGVGCVKGNAIVVTTRSMKVASIVNPIYTHELEGLSEEECWSIIKVKTFGEENVPSEFETIGKKIATKCQGLPLAANVVGGTLSNQSEEKWRSIEEKWLSPDEGGDNIRKILRLSFDNLSLPSLKKCFAYCAMFPKGSKIRKQELIEFWMAEGFLQADGRDDMESLGEKFISVLLHNSLLHISSSSNSTCGSRVRYMTLLKESSPIPKEMAKSLRTLLMPFKGDSFGINFSDLESLHVLRLEYGVKELSSSIQKLIHLRDFDISWTSIEYLPDWIGEFFHLQTLRVESYKLRKLPSTIKDLINLRHLYINHHVELPAGIGRLTSLQTLRHFPVGDENGCKIEELGSLNNLKGWLRIRNLERVDDKEEAEKANLFKKSKILDLYLEWNSRREGERNDENVLEGMRPHSDLRGLHIGGFKGKRFPLWTQKMPDLNKLMWLSLWDCRECEEIPMLGHLPNLKSLKLKGWDNLKCINSSFYGMVNKNTRIVFPALEKLKLNRMPKLTEWAEIEVSGGSEVKLFPRLQHLKISRCEQLMSVPSHVSSCLQHLEIYGTGLECLPADWLFSNNQTLSELYIWECPNLRELGDRDSGGEQSQGSFTSLRKIWISGCKALEHLPCEMLGFSLEELRLVNLSSLKNLPRVIDCLPKLPFPSLREIEIDVSMGVETVDAILQGCCHSLDKLILMGMESWECLQESIQLLTALSQLSLFFFGMEELPEWFGNLSSLKELWLWDCKRLRRLPSMDAMHRLTTLKTVKIWDCPELVIKREAADSEWPKVSHIPYISIDNHSLGDD